MEKINHGALFKGKTSNIGIAICLLSFLLFFTSISIIIPLITLSIGIIFFMSIQIVEIDYENKRIRKALNLIFYKHGEWMPLDDFDRLVFGANHESIKMISPAHPLFQKDINLRSYDIYIVNSKDAMKTFVFLSCSSIQEGQQKLEEYSQKLNIEMIDTIKQGWENIRKRNR